MRFQASIISVCVIAVVSQSKAQTTNAENWNYVRYQEKVSQASIRNSDINFFTVACRIQQFGTPELTVSVRITSKSRLRPPDAFTADIKLDQTTIQLPLVFTGEHYGDRTYRWSTENDKDIVGLAKTLSDVYGGNQVSVGAPGTDEKEVFPYQPDTISGLGRVVQGCTSSSINAHDQAAKLTDVNKLLVLEDSSDDRCRGGVGGEDVTQAACNERDAYYDRLRSLGMCYGLKGQISADERWHRCGPNSNR